MEWILVFISLILILLSAALMITVRISLLTYSQKISDCLDDMIAGNEELVFEEEKETLTGKLQSRLRRLYEIMNERAVKNRNEKEALESTLSDVSHQIKTPIANIRMYQNLLKDAGLPEERQTEFLDAQERQIDKLEFLMQSLVKMSRLEAGIIKLHSRHSNVSTLVEQAVCDIALKAEAKEIRISVNCDNNLSAWFDLKWSGEALFNLLDNAVKYTQPCGSIEISAKTTDYYVCIRIKDNGRGIAEKHLTEIFKRFYREPQSASLEGVGIGLYLTREIVTMQHGFLEVSSSPGQGSVFSMSLPIEEP